MCPPARSGSLPPRRRALHGSRLSRAACRDAHPAHGRFGHRSSETPRHTCPPWSADPQGGTRSLHPFGSRMFLSLFTRSARLWVCTTELKGSKKGAGRGGYGVQQQHMWDMPLMEGALPRRDSLTDPPSPRKERSPEDDLCTVGVRGGHSSSLTAPSLATSQEEPRRRPAFLAGA